MKGIMEDHQSHRDFSHRHAIVGVFPNLDCARSAVSDLVSAGVGDERIRMIDAEGNREHVRTDEEHDARPGFLRRLFGFQLDRDDARLAGYVSRLDEDERYFSSLIGAGEELVIVDAIAQEDIVADILQRNGGRLEAAAVDRFVTSADEFAEVTGAARDQVLFTQLADADADAFRRGLAFDADNEREIATGEIRVREEVVPNSRFDRRRESPAPES